MIRSRVIPKSRQLLKSRELLKSRSIGGSGEISDCWATVNQDATGVTLSYLVDDDNLNTSDKIVLLNGIEQLKGYTTKLYDSTKHIYHTELSLNKDTNYTIKLSNDKTYSIKLPSGNLKIAYMSDMHYLANPQTTNTMFNRIKDTNPDYLLCGGDWVLDDTASAGGHQWVNFINNGMSILNQNRIIPWLPPTIGNHDHVGTGRGVENGISLTSNWYGVPSDVQYLHNVFPFDNGEPTKGYGLVDLTSDISVFVTDFCTTTLLDRQHQWFTTEAKTRKNKKNIFVSHIQLFPSDRPRNVTPFLQEHYFPTIYDYFQLGLDGHDHSLSTTKAIVDPQTESIGTDGVRFYGQGGMSDKWYDGSQADAWYMDEVVLRQNHFHLLEYNGSGIAVTPIDKNGDELWTHAVNRATKL